MPQWSGAPRRYGKQGSELSIENCLWRGVRVLGVFVIAKTPTSAELSPKKHVNYLFAAYFPNLALSPCAGMPSENSILFVQYSGALSLGT